MVKIVFFMRKALVLQGKLFFSDSYILKLPLFHQRYRPKHERTITLRFLQHERTFYMSDMNDNHSEVYRKGIFILEIDIAHDVCVVSSPEIAKIPLNEGFSVNKVYTELGIKGALVFVNGYPFGLVKEKSTRAYLDNLYPVKLLQECIPIALANKMVNKNSPDLNSKVFDLNGSIAPGHSGAPVLLNNEVIGIVNGGLYNGQSGFGWAMIYKDLSLQDFKKDRSYRSLKPESLLYTYDFAPEPLLDTMIAANYPPNEIVQNLEAILKHAKAQYAELRGLPISATDSGSTLRFLSKVNYFNGIRTVINVRGKFGVVNTTLVYQDEIRDRLLLDPLAYNSIEANYQEVSARLQNSLYAKKAVETEVNIDRAAGIKYHLFKLPDDDAAIVLTLIKNKQWKLVISVYDHISAQPNLFN